MARLGDSSGARNSSQQLPGGVGGLHGDVPGEPAIPNRLCILPKTMSAPLLSYSPNQDLMEAKTESPSDKASLSFVFPISPFPISFNEE